MSLEAGLVRENMMPKKIYLPPDATDSGVEITWTPSGQRLDVSGWYEHCAGLEGGSMSLRDFFDALDITEKDCAKAWGTPAIRKQP